MTFAMKSLFISYTHIFNGEISFADLMIYFFYPSQSQAIFCTVFYSELSIVQKIFESIFYHPVLTFLLWENLIIDVKLQEAQLIP